MLFTRLKPYLFLFFFIQLIVRLSLLAHAWHDEIDFSGADILGLFLRGAWFDVVVGCFFMLPPLLYAVALPSHFHGGRLDRRADSVFRFVFFFVLLFDAVAEHLFWSEFSTRFNFIAVDYLIYTQEVIGNINESYPMPVILSVLFISSLLLTWLSKRCMPFKGAAISFKRRGLTLAGAVALSGLLYAASDSTQSQFNNNAAAGELAANGIYNLFAAFWNNDISYDRFYAMQDKATVARNARVLMEEEKDEFLHDSGEDLTRIVRAGRPEQHKNVVIVVMESLSAEYMGAFGNTEGLTPNLDRLAKEGLLFSNLYATGTRTVRGLEAATLSIPPTPGQSIIRRPHNENLFSVGFIFKDRGYDTRFLYGGYGYFDNMNAFFSSNGFAVVDRTSLNSDEIHFANVWGVADDDMFARLIKEADASYAAGKPFMHMLMTTSNHRPYTYPNGKIDIPAHSGRLGGVKYADYSIGKLMEWAKKKPWFKNTVFVFVADHTAGAGGKVELDPRRYHIPMIFYAPGFIKPGRYDKLASQIDLAPILLGQLNFTYYSKFYGEDLLHDDDEVPHAFISNYQKVALVKEDEITVLEPKRKVVQLAWPDETHLGKVDQEKIDQAIAYYQTASWWKTHHNRISTRAEGNLIGASKP